MTREDEYAAAAVVPLTSMREAIEKRPDMYFGGRPRSSWPLDMMALTVIKLGRHVPSPDRIAQVTVHADGHFTVSVRGAITSWNPRRVDGPETALINDLWWRHVALSTTVTVSEPSNGTTTNEHGWHFLDGVDISVRMACDPAIAHSDASVWWDGWTSGLPTVIDNLVRRPEDECRVVMVDERIG